MVLLEEKRRSYVAAPALWKDLKPCRALAVPTSPVFAYKLNVIADVNEDGTVSI